MVDATQVRPSVLSVYLYELTLRELRLLIRSRSSQVTFSAQGDDQYSVRSEDSMQFLEPGNLQPFREVRKHGDGITKVKSRVPPPKCNGGSSSLWANVT